MAGTKLSCSHSFLLRRSRDKYRAVAVWLRHGVLRAPHRHAIRSARAPSVRRLRDIETDRANLASHSLSALGHFRQMGTVPTLTGCPLRFKSGYAHACHDMSA